MKMKNKFKLKELVSYYEELNSSYVRVKTFMIIAVIYQESIDGGKLYLYTIQNGDGTHRFVPEVLLETAKDK